METAVFIVAVVFFFILPIGFAVVILRVVDRLTLGKTPTLNEQNEQQEEFETRLLNPQWDQLSQHFGGEIPSVLKQLYADAERLHQTSFYVTPQEDPEETEHHFIGQFEPADLVFTKQTGLPLGSPYFPFASDDFGNYYVVDFSTEDLCVGFYEIENGEISPVADTLEEFLNRDTNGRTSNR
ncbi:SMI1/KNR4 family protein [Pirellulaceae bacterium]|nr:SMI1/KNR4 family protein [Pirellulaceae bacterium]